MTKVHSAKNRRRRVRAWSAEQQLWLMLLFTHNTSVFGQPVSVSQENEVRSVRLHVWTLYLMLLHLRTEILASLQCHSPSYTKHCKILQTISHRPCYKTFLGSFVKMLWTHGSLEKLTRHNSIFKNSPVPTLHYLRATTLLGMLQSSSIFFSSPFRPEK